MLVLMDQVSMKTGMSTEFRLWIEVGGNNGVLYNQTSRCG